MPVVFLQRPSKFRVFAWDAGATFNEPIHVEDGENVGRVDTLLLPDGSALVCWLSGNIEGGEIKVRRVQANGTVGPPSVIAKTDISRSSQTLRRVSRTPTPSDASFVKNHSDIGCLIFSLFSSA